MLSSFLPHLRIGHDRRYAEIAGQRAHERRVVVSVGITNVMMKMRQTCEHHVAVLRQIMKQEGKGHGVRSTGDRRDHPRSRQPQVMKGGKSRYAFGKVAHRRPGLLFQQTLRLSADG